MLTLEEAEAFVANNSQAEWEGWTINIYRPFPGAYMRKAGAWYNGKWCLKTIVIPNNKGAYLIGKR